MDVAPDFVLPGAADIPIDSVVLLRVDMAAVAAFMAGLNHELARELVWRGFPVDREATFFRTFWDARGQAGGGVGIDPMADWPPGDTLATRGGADLVVLAVRGDLLRRYPRTRISAVRAVRDNNGVAQPADEDQNTRDASFTGFLPPDMRFFGFQLGEARSTPRQPGWFFALQEPSTEARFGGPARGSGAAEIARSAWRPPVRVLIHADDLLAP